MTTTNPINTINPARQESAAVSTFAVANVRIIDSRPFINQWRRGKRVGKGQHGRVYECHHQTLPQVVAIKVVDRQESKRDQQYKILRKKLPSTPHTSVVNALSTNENKIMREIAIMTRCNHPNVVKLQEVINDPMSTKIYMVMEFMGGGEVLWKDANDNPILSASQARRVMRDAILGVEYLHFQGIIHRDIKPANLLWTTDRSRVKISDFGVSHFSIAQWISNGRRGGGVDPILDDDRDLSKRAGTPAFLAPELVYEHMPPDPSGEPRPKPPITAAIDIWALGATFYCLLFGRTPFNPAPGIPSGIAKEFSIYTAICTQDWTPRETMGVDRVPTGGRHPKEDPKDDGYLVMKLLDQLLQKDVAKRMVMKELKNYPWLSLDLKAACLWLEKSVNQTQPIEPTASEASSPLTSMMFSYGLNRIGSLLRLGRRRSSRRSKRTESIGASSDPSLLITHRSTPASSQPGSPTAKAHNLTVRSSKGKGKRRTDLRAMAIETHAEAVTPLYTPKGSTSSFRVKSKHRPVSQIFDAKSHTPRMSEASLNDERPPRSRFHLNLSNVFGWRPHHKSSSQLSSPASPPSGTVTSVPSELMTPGLAHTNESLNSGMRASSWASNAFEYDMTSVHSDAPDLDDEALFVGAGGVLIDGSRSRAFISPPDHRSSSRMENLEFDDDRFDDICDDPVQSKDPGSDGDGYSSENYTDSDSDGYDGDGGIEIPRSSKKTRNGLPPSPPDDSRSPTPSIR